MRRLWEIVRRNDVVRLEGLDDAEKHRCHAVESARRLASGRREIRQCVICPVEDRVGIEKDESFHSLIKHYFPSILIYECEGYRGRIRRQRRTQVLWPFHENQVAPIREGLPPTEPFDLLGALESVGVDMDQRFEKCRALNVEAFLNNEGWAGYLLLGNAESRGESLHERRLPCPQVAVESNDRRAVRVGLETTGELGGNRSGLMCTM